MEENKNYTTVEKLNTLMEEKYLEFLNCGKIKEILTTIGKFDKETIENDILILEQMPEASEICTKGEWEKIKHRQLIDSPKFINLIGVTLYKNEQGAIDSKGSLHVEGTLKLHPYVKTVYDISQTISEEAPKTMNKEYLATYFDAVKGSLEHTTKDYKIKYDDIAEKSQIDRENKLIIVQNGMSLNDVVCELIDNTARVLIDCRLKEGLKSEQHKDILSLEHKCAIYAIHSRYGLDMPEMSFEEIGKFSDEDKLKFMGNLSKVRSVVYQITHNLENSIDFTIRSQNREKSKENEGTKQSNKQIQNQNEGEL